MESGWWLWAYIYIKRILCDLVFDSSVERCFTGRLSKSNQSTDFKISVQSIVVHLAVFACCKPPINRQLCLVRVASSASFNPNLEHFWVNGRIVCPEWQWNKENYPHKRPVLVLDAFWIKNNRVSSLLVFEGIQNFLPCFHPTRNTVTLPSSLRTQGWHDHHIDSRKKIQLWPPKGLAEVTTPKSPPRKTDSLLPKRWAVSQKETRVFRTINFQELHYPYTIL